ncbi:hypothetical protein FOD75_11460 (plasmid) [Limosilactobacillus reuteri]|uniref:Uncharacterized protein n=1 Tax=Limosilactobacillus reuteri TaxID=1598 RepID=A0A517D8L1_LIMRT|nr:hypothetical protein [Limosilactobacillus reuteri]QDR73700.1 hypothetical protein FOD75_11460 [Limosilactobacillus reuteri]
MYFSENSYYLFNKKKLIRCLQEAWGLNWKNWLKVCYTYDDADQVAEFFENSGWKYKVRN